MSKNNKTIYLISNGDFRTPACLAAWPMQDQALKSLRAGLKKLGYNAEVLPKFDKKRKHGFLMRQCEGAEVIAKLPPDAPVAVVLSTWAFSHHITGSLQTHKGPILLIGNFDGTWPGLVALLNHAGTLDRLGVKYSRLWSETFADDEQFMKQLQTWCEKGEVRHSSNHLADASKLKLSSQANKLGEDLAADMLKNKRILGQMDPGCMGMYNAVLGPDKLGAIGMPLELLNQSDLVAEMNLVDEKEAQNHLNWLVRKGVWFNWGTDKFEHLVHSQVLEQMKMYSAAARIYQRYGLSAIGIPYQLGLVRSAPASDLVEGMLNNADRPNVRDPETRQIVNKGRPIVHFNEGDLGSAVPQVIMNDIYQRKGMAPETTLHDVRWGREYEGKFVWVFEISGAAPPAHYGGWKHAMVYRQPNVFFPLGGGTCSGVSKPGVITWARFYEKAGQIGMDCGTGEVLKLPEAEVEDRRRRTTYEWPIANVHIPGYGRDECMATHMANHITMGYGDILEELIATCRHLGIPTRVAGDARKTLK